MENQLENERGTAVVFRHAHRPRQARQCLGSHLVVFLNSGMPI